MIINPYVLNKIPLTFKLNTKCTDHNFLFVNCPFQSINKQTKIIRAVKSRAPYALATQPVTACCILGCLATMTSCIANEMEDREYCPLSPEGILFLTTERKY